MASNLYSTIYRALDSLLHMKTFHYIIPVVGTLIAVQCSCSQNAEEQALFRRLVARNASNMSFESHEVIFTSEAELENCVKKIVEQWDEY